MPVTAPAAALPSVSSLPRVASRMWREDQDAAPRELNVRLVDELKAAGCRWCSVSSARCLDSGLGATYGYRRLHVLVVREGHAVNHKRIHRLQHWFTSLGDVRAHIEAWRDDHPFD
jgi:HTH-like domain